MSSNLHQRSTNVKTFLVLNVLFNVSTMVCVLLKPESLYLKIAQRFVGPLAARKRTRHNFLLPVST
jgi:hypothetical protein